MQVSDESHIAQLNLPQELEWALAEGWKVFPVENRGKAPLVKWREAASSDPARVVAWIR